MKTVIRYTKEEAQAIIAANEQMQRELEDLKPYYEEAALDHGFECGNFFSCPEIEDHQICIQWCGDDIDVYHELVVDSLEELVVTINEIEAASGNISILYNK